MTRRVLIVSILLAVVGCGRRPATHPVSGVVTFSDGEPVRSGLIEFLPVEGGSSARASLNQEGRYLLGVFATGDGAIAGDYVVVISQPQIGAGTLRPPPTGHIAEEHGGEHPPLGLVPTRYASPQTSGLEATVYNSPNTIDFQLDRL